MRKATRPAPTMTDRDSAFGQLVAGDVGDAGNWTWPNPLDQLVEVLERAVARRRIRTASDLTGN
jgi:hypothetical protein